MVIAIDFDGTIHDIAHPVPGRRMGPPIEGSQRALKALKAAGHTIVIFTARGGHPEHVAEWMKYYDMPYDEITNIKKYEFDLIVDDRAVTFTTWRGVLE